jgi:hypothetical protein
MSQFLWVEDFGNLTIEATTKSIFGEILRDQQIPENKYRLKKFLKNNGVLLKLDFLEALDFIRNPEQLPLIDCIILEVWLPVPAATNHDYLRTILQRYDDADEQTAITQLEKTAGYQLYVELVMELGFPKEHILFCSNHAEELGYIRKAFENAKIELKPILTKGKEDRLKVQAWVKERRENHYAVLRRGIIEGCQRISSLIQNHPEFLQFGEFLIDSNGEVTVKDMQEYLETLQNLLPLREPQDKQRFYKLLVRTLTHEWDAADPKLQIDEQVNFTFGWIMKNARNWSTHTTVLDDLAAQDVAFLFLVAMRAMFKLGSAPQAYEETYLLTLFEETPDLEKIPLAATYSQAKRLLLKKERAADALYFNTMLNNMVNNNIDYDYVTALFQMFWHGLAPVSSKLAKSNVYSRGSKATSEVNYIYTFDIAFPDLVKYIICQACQREKSLQAKISPVGMPDKSYLILYRPRFLPLACLTNRILYFTGQDFSRWHA